MLQYPKVINSMETARFAYDNFPREYWEKDFEELLAEDTEIKVLGKIEADVTVPISKEEADELIANRDQWEYPQIIARQNGKSQMTLRTPTIRYKDNAYQILLPDMENIQTYAAEYGIDENFITAALVMGVTPDMMDDYLNGQGLLGGTEDGSESGSLEGAGESDSGGEQSSTGTENDQGDVGEVHGETLE